MADSNTGSAFPDHRVPLQTVGQPPGCDSPDDCICGMNTETHRKQNCYKLVSFDRLRGMNTEMDMKKSFVFFTIKIVVITKIKIVNFCYSDTLLVTWIIGNKND